MKNPLEKYMKVVESTESDFQDNGQFYDVRFNDLGDSKNVKINIPDLNGEDDITEYTITKSEILQSYLTKGRDFAIDVIKEFVYSDATLTTKNAFLQQIISEVDFLIASLSSRYPSYRFTIEDNFGPLKSFLENQTTLFGVNMVSQTAHKLDWSGQLNQLVDFFHQSVYNVDLNKGKPLLSNTTDEIAAFIERSFTVNANPIDITSIKRYLKDPHGMKLPKEGPKKLNIPK